MAFSYTTTSRDEIANRMFGTGYSALVAKNKAVLDGNYGGSMPATTGFAGAVRDAYTIVSSFARAWGQTGSNVPPDVWEPWFIHEACYALAVVERPDREDQYRKLADRYRDSCIQTLTGGSADDSAVSGSTFNYLTARRYILAHCARRRPMIVPSVEVMDQHISAALNELYNRSFWNFRKRRVDVTLGTDGIPTFSVPGGETFRALATRRWYQSDYPSNQVVWANADDMAALLAQNGSTTGRPLYMRLENRGNSLSWSFCPLPDQTYTFKAEVYVSGPGAPANATDAAPFNKFPAEFRPIIMDLALVRTLEHHGVRSRTGQNVDERIAALSPQYEDHGVADTEQAIRDVYNDAAAISGWNQIGGVL